MISSTVEDAVTVARAVVFHQLREPLMSLQNCLQEIQQESDGNPETLESTRESIRSALHETKRARAVIDLISPSRRAQQCDSEHATTSETETVDVAPHLRTGQLASDDTGQERLTPRERQVLDLVTAGISNKDGGYRLSISVRTFEAHRANIMGKFGARNAADLVRLAASSAVRSK